MITKTSMVLEGMDCSDCELVLEHRLGRLEGVVNVEADFTAQSLEIRYDSQRINRRLIEKRIRQMGYEPAPSALARWLRSNRELLFSLISGALLLIGWLGGITGVLAPQVAFWFVIAAYLPAGYDLARETLRSLRARHFDTDLLMFAAALGAAALGEFVEGALLIFLFSLGHALQERALDRARHAVHALADLTPHKAVVRRGGMDVVVPVEKLSLQDTVIVRPGERLPVDGQVVSGKSYVNEAPLTGESMPVEKAPGDKVFAGSLNADGTLEVQVSRLAADSTLSRVLKLVEQAQASRSPTQLGVERFTRVFVPLVLLVFAGLLVYPLLIGASFEEGFLRALTFLVAASPCALALGTPSAILSGVAQAARNGVLVKGGVYLEFLGRLKAIAFDKTGTLTLGQPKVTDVVATPGYSSEQVLELAASVEGRSTHPLAQAIFERAQSLEISYTPAEAVENLTGRGMRARLDGRLGNQVVWVGGLALWKEQNLALPAMLEERMRTFEAQGKTLVIIGVEEQAVGLIAIADALRPEAQIALKGLAKLGLRQSIMLSGDNARAAASIADQIGLADYRAELMPEEKLDAVNQLVKTYGYVGMVGDGINDAPALAQATVGIALGSAGNDVALEAADVALMAPDLCKLPFAVGLGRAMQRVTRQNLAISLSSILLLSVFGLSGLLPIGPIVILHEGATLLVVGNALRLFGFQHS